MADARVPVIVGPTAAGKTALALALAERGPVMVISADSRQVYRGFDVGTAKPSAEERGRVPHLGVDIAEPAEQFSAARWSTLADGWLSEVRAAGRQPLVVGGTGFYVRALFAPLFEEPPLDPLERRRLAEELGRLDTEALRDRVRVADPERAGLGRTQLLRALEVHTLTGIPISAWHRSSARPARHRARYLVVDAPGSLAQRIARRADAMLAAGWVDEVRALESTVPAHAPAWNATGYAAVRDCARGTLAPAEAGRRVVVATRQYAKRQRTWCRHQLPAASVTHLDSDAPDALDRALEWWQHREDP